MTYSKEELERVARVYGVENITDEEYESNKKWSIKSVIINIKNTRSGAAQGMVGIPTKAILLGGREFIRPTVPLGEARSHTILAYVEEGDETDRKKVLRELTVWGHLKDAKHGDGVIADVQYRETEKDNRVYKSWNARKLVVKLAGQATTERLNEIAEDIGVVPINKLTEDHLIDVSDKGLIVEGQIVNIEKQPKWEEGAIADYYPYWFNEKPCVRLGLSMETGNNKVWINIKPTHLAEPYILFPDFAAICQLPAEEQMFNLLLNRHIRVFGAMVRYTPGVPAYFDIDVCMIQELDIKPAGGVQSTIDEPSIAKPPSPTPEQTPIVKNAKNKAEQIRQATIASIELLGEQWTTQAALATGLFPDGTKEVLVEAFYKKVTGNV